MPIKIISARDYRRYIEIVADAYPGFEIDSQEKRSNIEKRLLRVQKEDTRIHTWGLYRRNELLGGIRLFDFDMTIFDRYIPVGGGGLLAVDLTHKKEKVAMQLMRFFIRHYRRRGTALTALYPFRPDFYRRMGYGYGTKTSLYRIKPSHLPDSPDRKHVRFAGPKDMPKIVACYNRLAARTHGMMKRCRYEVIRLQDDKIKKVIYERRGETTGYIAFTLKNVGGDDFLAHDLQMAEFVYENREALLGLTAFLRSQADQVKCIVWPTADENVHFLPTDPRDESRALFDPISHVTNTQGVGLMYRIADTPGLFQSLEEHRFGGVDIRLKITARDSFIPENDKSVVVHFDEGYPAVKRREKYDAEIMLDIAQLSSLFMGVVDFRTLHTYGLANISDTTVLDTVNELFHVPVKPRCLTQF